MEKSLRLMWRLALVTLATFMTLGIAACGGDDDPAGPPPPPEPGVLDVVVRAAVADTTVVQANVVVFRAENGEAVVRGLTDADGRARFRVDEGDYFLNVAAQGFEPIPRETVTPIPFFVAWDDTVRKPLSLDPMTGTSDTGYVMGTVGPAGANFLVLAESATSQESFATAAGPDGFYVFFNLPYGTYDLTALKAGYLMDAPVTAEISAAAVADTADIAVSTYSGSRLTGSVTFLAIENSVVDITLLDPETRAVVPGLTVMNEAAGLTYGLDRIPDGEYLAWASLRNDGFVIDPDWVFKNPDGLDVAFMTAGDVELNFSVTGAITLVWPTNPADSTAAAMAAAPAPVFRWVPYPSAKEYFIEVRDFNGNVLWGGMNPDGTVNHAFIPANADSVAYNFDGQPGVPDLEPGHTYQWQLWADKGTQADSRVEQLISASEDLRGIFQVPERPVP